VSFRPAFLAIATTRSMVDASRSGRFGSCVGAAIFGCVAPAVSRGRRARVPLARSKAWPRRSTVVSPNGRAMSCMPMGKPSALKAAQRARAGPPRMLAMGLALGRRQKFSGLCASSRGAGPNTTESSASYFFHTGSASASMRRCSREAWR